MILRVATFNLRNSSAPDDVHARPLRREVAAVAIESLDADVVGLQEVLPGSVRGPGRALPGYELIGAG